MVSADSTNSPAKDDFCIRRYQPSDLPEVRTLFVDGMKANNAPDSYIQRSLETDLSTIEDTYFIGRGTFLVLERKSDGKILGTVGLEDLLEKKNKNNSQDQQNQSREEDCRDLCELRRMSIHSSQRRNGLGKRLIREFIEFARRKGYDGITLSTGGWMEAAIRFYVAMGFKEMGKAVYNHEGKEITIANLEMLFS